MATPTWRTREVPILEAIAQLTIENERVGHSSEIAIATGLTDPEVALGIERLADAEYVQHGGRLRHLGGGRSYVGVELFERSLREVGVWPNEGAAGAFVAVMDERTEAASDPNSARASRSSGMQRSESAKESWPEC